MEEFISQCLAGVPEGNYRARTEKELGDHLECQRRALLEAGRTEAEARAETLGLMGDPEKLKEEYLAAWKRSLPGRLAALGFCLRSWAGGLAVTAGTHLLIYFVIGIAHNLALSLPGDSQEPWIRLIRGTVGDIHNSLFWRHLFPFALALTIGAYYLGRRFRTARRPAALIIPVLCVHWAYIVAYMGMWQAIDDHHMPFWTAFGEFLARSAWYHLFTLQLCILLGVLFAQKRERSRELA